MLRGAPIGGVESPTLSLAGVNIIQRALERFVPGSSLIGRLEDMR